MSSCRSASPRRCWGRGWQCRPWPGRWRWRSPRAPIPAPDCGCAAKASRQAGAADTHRRPVCDAEGDVRRQRRCRAGEIPRDWAETTDRSTSRDGPGTGPGTADVRRRHHDRVRRTGPPLCRARSRRASRWVENRWVLPEEQRRSLAVPRGRCRAGRADPRNQARIRSRWRGVALVLGLLDQLYSLRRQMRRLCSALESQPPEVQDAIRQALPKADRSS